MNMAALLLITVLSSASLDLLFWFMNYMVQLGWIVLVPWKRGVTAA